MESRMSYMNADTDGVDGGFWARCFTRVGCISFTFKMYQGRLVVVQIFILFLFDIFLPIL